MQIEPQLSKFITNPVRTVFILESQLISNNIIKLKSSDK